MRFWTGSRRPSAAPSPVTVIGGANSAGQAALYLAGRGSQVSLVVRSGSVKRVAAATGEGASAIASVHQAIAQLI